MAINYPDQIRETIFAHALWGFEDQPLSDSNNANEINSLKREIE